ncbi:hypothetical protein FRB93_003554 [Tulasnella sp. JGI-2019a]|nr:hypothetical protein FRB93_003554 [Tulasnella sp. JGI-2019a]
MLSSTVLFSAALGLVNAHTIFQRVYVNGVDQGWTTGVRYPSYDGPITNVSSTDIICNGGPNPLVTPYSQTVIDIPAGATVTGEWHHGLQPDGYNPSDLADPIDISHLGPVMAYMAAVPSALQTDVTDLKWFKIWEDGFDGTYWGVNRLYNAHGLQNFTIPTCIPAGNYFLRLEIIALHGASVYPGAQFYVRVSKFDKRYFTRFYYWLAFKSGLDGMRSNQCHRWWIHIARHCVVPWRIRGYRSRHHDRYLLPNSDELHNSRAIGLYLRWELAYYNVDINKGHVDQHDKYYR